MKEPREPGLLPGDAFPRSNSALGVDGEWDDGTNEV